MEKEEIKRKIIELVETKSDENAQITDDKPLKELGLDSLDCIELMIDVEREFDVEIPDEKSENVRTIEDVVNIVIEHKK
jgi:acyl carrier protein